MDISWFQLAEWAARPTPVVTAVAARCSPFSRRENRASPSRTKHSWRRSLS